MSQVWSQCYGKGRDLSLTEHPFSSGHWAGALHSGPLNSRPNNPTWMSKEISNSLQTELSIFPPNSCFNHSSPFWLTVAQFFQWLKSIGVILDSSIALLPCTQSPIFMFDVIGISLVQATLMSHLYIVMVFLNSTLGLLQSLFIRQKISKDLFNMWVKSCHSTG